ncbi:MAG: hypothetical protein PVF82_13610 [Gammaproteobacteria bacterium]|jgi:hypothetical protein
MVVQQSTTQRNQQVAARALYATLGIACGSEIYGLFHQQYLRILTVEYGLLYATSFVLAFTYVWLTAKRNVQISVTQAGLEISHDEDVVRFAWQEVKQTKQPAAWRRHWLFELNNTRKIKISTHYFSRKQIQQFNKIIIKVNTTRRNGAADTQITHPRVINSDRP